MNFIEVAPYVLVYKSLHEDSEKLFSYVKTIESESDGSYIFSPWENWFTFGDYCHAKIPKSNAGVTNSAEINEVEKYCYDQIRSATVTAINHYSEHYNVEWPDKAWITEPNLAKYDDENKISDERKSGPDGLRMVFHSDYPTNEWFWPGRKFLVTGNTYINDNYDGGELIFLNSDSITVYKPEAGDVVVFPSGSPLFPSSPSKYPFFHAVNRVTNGYKYFVRSYICYDNYDLTYWDNKKSEFNTEEEWNQYIDWLSKNPHGDNTAEVYMGSPPASKDFVIGEQYIDCPKFSFTEFNPETDFWIGVTPLLMDLFDLQDSSKYFVRKDDQPDNPYINYE